MANIAYNILRYVFHEGKRTAAGGGNAAINSSNITAESGFSLRSPVNAGNRVKSSCTGDLTFPLV